MVNEELAQRLEKALVDKAEYLHAPKSTLRDEAENQLWAVLSDLADLVLEGSDESHEMALDTIGSLERTQLQQLAERLFIQLVFAEVWLQGEEEDDEPEGAA